MKSVEDKAAQRQQDCREVTLPPQQHSDVSFVDDEQLKIELTKVQMRSLSLDFRQVTEVTASDLIVAASDDDVMVVRKIVTYAEVVQLQPKDTLNKKIDRSACMWAPIRGLEGYQKFSRYRIPPEPTWPVVFDGEDWKVIEVLSDYEKVELQLQSVEFPHIQCITNIDRLDGYESYKADAYRRARNKREENLHKRRVEKELPKRKSIVERTLADARYIESSTFPTPIPEETMGMTHAQWEQLKKRWRHAVLADS